MATPAEALEQDLTPSAFSIECYEAAQSYIDEVMSGRVVVGKLERLAVERFAADTVDPRYALDHAAIDRVFRFFSVLRHTKTRQWSGRQLRLAGWQAFILLALFGLVHADTGLRVFRIAYIQIARKNGKSTFAAGIALYLLMYDNESGAEVYSAATKRDQAKIVWRDAAAMVNSSPQLSAVLEVRGGKPGSMGVANITYPDQFSKFEPVGADANTLDGLNPHGVVVDELHAHKTADMWNVMITGQGARLQPLQVGITTAGVDMDGVCYEQRDYAIKVLDDTVDDPEFFAFVCELDEDDDWLEEKNWRKGNPNLGISVRVEELRSAARRAAETPSNQNDFRTKRLDEWCQQADRWLDMNQYKACPRDPVKFVGRVCYGGLDLSSTKDFTAQVLVFPPDEEVPVWAILPTFWLPEAQLRNTELGQMRKVFEAWYRQGWIKVTPGNVVDYDFIRAEVQVQGELYQIQEIGYDPYNATQIVVQLAGDGFDMVAMRQGAPTLHAPCKELERLIASQQINPGASPVLQWNASNVFVITDSNGNMKPSRSNKRLKIDGIVGTIMALGRAMAAIPEDSGASEPMVLRAEHDDD